MRRVGAWGMAAALIVGLGAAIAAAQGPDDDLKPTPTKGGWWVGEKPRYRGDKPFKKAKTPAKDKPALPSAAETANLELERQQNAVERRIEVCDRLRQIALDTGNEELFRRAEELEARAWEIYRKQTANLPLPTSSAEADTEEAVAKPTPGGEVRGGNQPIRGRDKP